MIDVEQIVESEVDPSRWSFRQFSASSISEDYTPSQNFESMSTTDKLMTRFNEVFYMVKEEVFSILGVEDIARTFGLI